MGVPELPPGQLCENDSRRERVPNGMSFSAHSWWEPPPTEATEVRCEVGSPAVILQVDFTEEETLLSHALTSFRWAVIVCKPLDDLSRLVSEWRASLAIATRLGVMQLSSFDQQDLRIIGIADGEADALELLGYGASFVLIRPIDRADPLATSGIDASSLSS